MADARYDAIVIGAGHNGLTAAALLARRGRRVLVVERRDVTGGLSAGEEFHPGYHSAGVLHDTACVRPAVADALSLREHGLELEAEAPRVLLAQADGPGLLLSEDAERAGDEISRHSPVDAKRYVEFRRFIRRIRGVVEPLLNEPPIDPAHPGAGGLAVLARHGLAARALGARDMTELLRIPPMCVADWLREWFGTELLCAGLAAPAILGTWCGPWSPGTAANLLLRECTSGRMVRGGAAALAQSLERAARAAGVEIRTGAPVTRVRVEGASATGVVLQGGEEVAAKVVLSTCDPRTTLLGLLAAEDIPHALENAASIYRMRGTTASVRLALTQPLAAPGRPDHTVEYARTGATLDDQERAFDAVKYRTVSERPILDVYVPSVARPELAPDGQASVSILAHFAPYELEGGWTTDARERLGDAVVAELERHFPGAAQSVTAREVLTPEDIEGRYGVTGGHVHHGEHALDQLITRPTVHTARYTTPIAGLYLGGGGSHPGGGVTCAPGALAARTILAAG